MLLKLTGGDGESGSLLVHLGMTGQIASLPATKPWEKHTHTSFLLDDGRELRYTDPRRFGRMAYLSGEGLKTHLAGFGTDPLEIGADDFSKKIRARAARIKALLLNQSVLRGVGNIYADESLWRAKIHPARLGSSLSKKQSLTLRRALQQILHRAILMRGSSISDYLDADGEPGDYQRRHQAYGREGQPCSRCRTKIRRSIVAGRSSFFCPKCQPAPRGRRRLPRTGKNDRRGSSTKAKKSQRLPRETA